MNLPNLKEARIRSDKKVKYLENDNNIKEVFKGKKYFLKTYGCQMNVHDSEEIRKYLEMLGFSETEVLEESDIVVLNTCAIRENAHDKVFGYTDTMKLVNIENGKDHIGQIIDVKITDAKSFSLDGIIE